MATKRKLSDDSSSTENKKKAFGRVEYNRRGFPETIFDSKHLSLKELSGLQNCNEYLDKYGSGVIPAYPRPEIHVTHLSHSTDLQGLVGIKKDGGFKDPNSSEVKVVWFSLTMTHEDLRDAETRKIIHPGGTEEDFTPGTRRDQARVDYIKEEVKSEAEEEARGGAEEVGAQGGVLQKFASSPAFASSSKYGSYRFTFSLQDVLDRYSQQFCGGQSPVMRVWRTVLYKQEVVYAVLVHSPTNQERFSEFPLLQEEPDSICAFREEPEPHFIWKPQAMSETHRFELIVNQKENTLSVSEELRPNDQEFYVWDHVTLALHVDDQVLQFTDKELRENLRFCEKNERPVSRLINYQSYEKANTAVKQLWPGEKQLEKFSESDFHIYP